MLRKSKILSLLLCFCLLFEQTGFAQVAGALDISGHLSAFRNSFIQDKFRPLHLRSLGYDNSQNNFRLLFDKGDLKNPKKPDLEITTKTLLNYFFVGVTLPNDTFWVNLRPDSENNIIDSDLATTDIGKILLEADLQLKKDTASFTSPETPEGKKYWDKLYQKAGELFGYENITIPTLTRPWIVPGEIIIRETAGKASALSERKRVEVPPSAYIYKATLKVMLEQDYLKDSATYNFDDPRLKTLNEYSSQLIRDLIIPKLTKEVNTSQRYASLRQVYYSLILAQWFKSRFYGKGRLYSWLIDRRGLQGLTSKISWSKATYFKAYQKSFKDGEYNLQQPVYTPYGQTIRSYFSGGLSLGDIPISPPPKPNVLSKEIRGPTEVYAISGYEGVSSPLTDKVVGALAVGGNTMDPSETKVTITEEASLPSGLPAEGLQLGASSVIPTVTSSEQSQAAAKQVNSPSLGAQISYVKNLDRLRRILNILAQSDQMPQVPESASEDVILEFILSHLEASGLIKETRSESDDVKIFVIKEEVKESELGRAIQRWVIELRGGVKAINFKGTDGIWKVVGFESEIDKQLDLEREEVRERKQGRHWIVAFNEARKRGRGEEGSIDLQSTQEGYKVARKDVMGASIADWFRRKKKSGEDAPADPTVLKAEEIVSPIMDPDVVVDEIKAAEQAMPLEIEIPITAPHTPVAEAVQTPIAPAAVEEQITVKTSDFDAFNVFMSDQPVVELSKPPTLETLADDISAPAPIAQPISTSKYSDPELNRLRETILSKTASAGEKSQAIYSLVSMASARLNPEVLDVLAELIFSKEASCLRQNLGNQMNKVLGCIADIMRMEEDRVVDADVELKDMLVLIEAGKPETELQCGLSQIKISPQEPQLVIP